MLSKSFAAALLAAVGADALVARDAPCCFQLSASGGPGGIVGQLSDGQNRIGQGLPAATYCLNNGAITDQNNRGCILTPPTTQLQCDEGAAPTPGFGLNDQGDVTYNGSTQFVACPTGDNGGFNIYTVGAPGQQLCVPVTLHASTTCKAPAQPTPSPQPQPKPQPQPSGQCPANLNGPFEFPHLLVPVSKSQPDRAYGSQYNAAITPDTSTLFNFDIPGADAGKTCSLIFVLNNFDTSGFALSGPGSISVGQLGAVATAGTTYNNAPKVTKDLGTLTVADKGAYTIASFPCPAGQAVGFEVSSVGGTDLRYFQDYNLPGVGLFITKC